jgi:hypothetical protein
VLDAPKLYWSHCGAPLASQMVMTKILGLTRFQVLLIITLLKPLMPWISGLLRLYAFITS